MVRFKNRYLLVEFLQPSSLQPASIAPRQSSLPGLAAGGDDNHDGLSDLEGDDELIAFPPVPFLLPLPSSDPLTPRLKFSDDGGSAIFKAVRSCVQDVFGDEGWGRVASSFKVIYHSSLTTLTLLRIARPHLRTLWAALTLLTALSGQAVLPRVVAVSGTIRKLQTRAVGYHRLVIAQMLASQAEGGLGGEGRRKVQMEGEKEREEMGAVGEQ